MAKLNLLINEVTTGIEPMLSPIILEGTSPKLTALMKFDKIVVIFEVGYFGTQLNADKINGLFNFESGQIFMFIRFAGDQLHDIFQLSFPLNAPILQMQNQDQTPRNTTEIILYETDMYVVRIGPWDSVSASGAIKLVLQTKLPIYSTYPNNLGFPNQQYKLKYGYFAPGIVPTGTPTHITTLSVFIETS